MYLTEQDYIRIEKDLASRAVKDSQFTKAVEAKEEDQIPILQDQINKLLSIQKLLNYISAKLNLDSFLKQDNIVQERGESTAEVISQKVVSEALNTIEGMIDGYQNANISNFDNINEELLSLNSIIESIGNQLVAIESKIDNKPNVDHVLVNDEYYDFSIADSEGHILVGFKDGHIKTKYFDSSQVQDK